MYNLAMSKKTITIQKDSQLISIYASGELTAIQKKVYNCLIYMSKEMLKKDSTIREFEVLVQDVINCISDKNINIKELKESIIGLQNIRVEFNVMKKNKNVVWSSFVLLAGAEIKDGVLKYNYAFQVLEHIEKPQSYAYLDLKIMKSLDTKHSISLYEILQDYKNLKVVDLELDKFKKSMDIKEEQYKRFGDFKDYVLEPSITEINEKTDLNISYEKITRGRKVTGLKFIIKESKAKQEQNKLISNRQSFIEFIRADKVNVSLVAGEDIYGNELNIACSEKGLLYDKLSGNTLDKEKADRLWSKLYELYKEQKMPWQKSGE